MSASLSPYIHFLVILFWYMFRQHLSVSPPFPQHSSSSGKVSSAAILGEAFPAGWCLPPDSGGVCLPAESHTKVGDGVCCSPLCLNMWNRMLLYSCPFAPRRRTACWDSSATRYLHELIQGTSGSALIFNQNLRPFNIPSKLDLFKCCFRQLLP